MDIGHFHPCNTWCPFLMYKVKRFCLACRWWGRVGRLVGETKQVKPPVARPGCRAMARTGLNRKMMYAKQETVSPVWESPHFGLMLV